MYRRRVDKNLLTASTSGVATTSASTSREPIPVHLSQRKQTQKPDENKNQENIISSSQNEEDDNLFIATQSYTQTQSRFKSQRAIIAKNTQLQRNQGKKSYEILLFNNDLEINDIGCELVDSKRDPISFTRSLRCFLTSQYDFADRVKSFLQEFNADFNLNDDEKLIKCEKFMRGIFVKDGDKYYQTQTSLIMCLFSIEHFKNELCKILLHRLKEYVMQKAEMASPMIIGLILTQLKFTDQILDDETYDFMFEELFAILNETKIFECREVIIQYFRELSLVKQAEAARRIYLIYENNSKSELLKFIDILCDMNIDDDVSNQIFNVIQQHMASECSVQHYPAMIKYSQYYSESAEDIIEMFRERIKWEFCTKSIIDDIFKLIDKLFKRDENKIIEKWTNVIAGINNKDDLNILDFIILLKIADTNTETQLRNVKKIVHDLISKGLFTDNYLKLSFKTFSSVVIENSQTMLELLDALQKTRDNQLIYSFLATCYKLLFRYSSEAKPIIGSLVNFLCEKRAQLPFSSASEFKVTILNIFNDVKNDKVASAASLLVNHKILLRALDLYKVELTFNEHRLFMEFLCALVYKIDYTKNFKSCQMNVINENVDTLREHLNMIVVKHMNNPEDKIKQLGLIGGVKIVSALVVDYIGDSQYTPNSAVTLETIPKGQIKEAAELVHLMMSAADNSEMQCALYDELSNEFRPTGQPRIVNELFVAYLGELMINKLEQIIVVPIETEHMDIHDLKFQNKCEIIDTSFESPDVVVNLGDLVFSESPEVSMIPSLFKLSHHINLQRFGDIEFMAGLCSMSIVLPEKFATEDDSLNDDEQIAKLQLDLYFHTCNWLREIIAGFINSSKDASIRKLVKMRLKSLIEIEKHLDRLMKFAPKNYIPPFLNFSQNENQLKTFESTMKMLNTKSNDNKPPAKKKSRKKVAELEVIEKQSFNIKTNQFCREMDNEVTLLLTEHFDLTKTRSDDDQFTLTELIYLLEDAHVKILTTFGLRKVETKGFTNEIKCIADIKAEILPILVKIFYKINEKMGDAMDTDVDEDLTNENLTIKKIFNIILEIFEIIYSSKKLKHEDHSNLLTEMLKLLLKTDTIHMRSQEIICAAIIEQFMEFEKNVKDIHAAVSLIDFLCTINSFCRDKINAKKICEMSERFLKRRWVNENRQLENGAIVNAKLEKLLKIYVKKASNLDEISELIAEMKTITEKNELTTNKTFPCISKTNLICMLRICIHRHSEIINMAKKSSINFDFWNKCTDIESEFMATVKWIKTAIAFNLFLKNFIVYLRKFNTDGMTFLSELACKDRQRFIQLVKKIQAIRRTAHSVACELKHRKNNSIASTLPTARQQFETFYQAASTIAKTAKIPSNAFSTGALKNFDIDGQDIFSQNTNAGDSTNTSINDDIVSDIEDDNDEGENNIGTPRLSDDTSDSEDEAAKQVSFRSRSTII